MISTLIRTARAALAAIVLLYVQQAAQAQQQPQLKPSPEQQRLEIWAGKWSYQGTEAETPLGIKGDFKGRSTNRMLANGSVLERHSLEKLGDWLSLVWYDVATKSYVTMSFTPAGGVEMGKLTVNGDTWVSAGELRDKNGKVWKTRDTTTFSSDGKTSTNKQEYSSDDGKTWLLWYTVSNKRTGK